MANYLKQLSADLPRWIEAGFVSVDGGQKILADATERQARGWFTLPNVLGALGALLVFVGVISYVAGHWNDIPRLARVALLIAFMAGAYLAGHTFRQKGSDGLGASFAFMGTLIFGANLMLIAQIYNLPPNPPGGAFLWMCAAVLTSLLWPSQLNMALAYVLAGIWSVFSLANTHSTWGVLEAAFDQHRIHWPFLLVWGGLTVVSVRAGWNKAMHLAGLSICWWAMLASFNLFDEDAIRFGGVIIALLLLTLAGAARLLKVAQEGTGIISRYLLLGFALWLLLVTIPDIYRHTLMLRNIQLDNETKFVAYTSALVLLLLAGLYGLIYDRLRTIAGVAAVGALLPLLSVLPVFAIGFAGYDDSVYQSVSGFNFVSNILLSAVALTAGIGLIIQGYRLADRFLINIGFVLFGLKLIHLYFDTFWTFNARAPFFIIGGLLVIALAVGFDRQRRKLIKQMEVRHAR